MTSADMDTLRVLLLGKTGVGKSTLGNALTGGADKEFQVGRGMKSKTFAGEWRKRMLDDLTIEVVDTPGLCDTHMDDCIIYKEVGKSVALAEPGPHVLIFTLRCDKRFTKEEWKAYRTIKEMFSSEMNKFMIVVFNGLDELVEEGDKERSTIEQQRKLLKQEVDQFGGEVKLMLGEASGRYFGMNNKASETAKEQQIRDLIKMMKDLVRQNGNQFYKTKVTTEIQVKVDDLIEVYAAQKEIPRQQAEEEVKRNISEERVSLSFLDFLGSMVGSLASGIKDACRIS